MRVATALQAHASGVRVLGYTLKNNLFCSRKLIQKRRYSAALQNVAVTLRSVVVRLHFKYARGSGALKDLPYRERPHRFTRSRKKRPRSFSFRSRCCYCDKIIVALAVAFLLVLSSCRVPAAPVPGCARHPQMRHLVAAAAETPRPAFFLFGRALHRLQRLAAQAVDHMRPVLFLWHRALPPQVRHLAEAWPVDEIRTADLRHAAHAPLLP